MRYWDTSALVPLLFRELSTRAMASLLESDPQVITWWGTEIECISAIARLERETGVPAARTGEAVGRLARLARGWQEVQPSDEVRTTAKRLLRVHPLRAADSMQLAAAIVASEGRPGTLELVCLDERLASAAVREGFPLAGSGQRME